MVKYAIERLLMAVVTAFVVLTLTFFLVHLLPFEQPATTTSEEKLAYFLLQVRYGNVLDFRGPTEGYGELLWSTTDVTGYPHYFYQTPILDQYVAWLRGVFTSFSWGPSNAIMKNVDAMQVIIKRLPTTIKVNIWPAVISVPLGIGLGIWAALKKNKLTDHIISTLVMVFISVPSFIIITLLLLTFSYTWHILPSFWPSKEAETSRKILAYFIPTMALSFGSICSYCRFTRAELTEVMSSDFLLLARTKGLTKNQAIVRHALKNAMVPILPSILSEVIGLLAGAMILEKLYVIPGVGSLYVEAISYKDYSILMADMSFYTIISLISAVFLDLSYGLIDPRIRMGSRK